jgi:microsomal epoxide hydrolase
MRNGRGNAEDQTMIDDGKSMTTAASARRRLSLTRRGLLKLAGSAGGAALVPSFITQGSNSTHSQMPGPDSARAAIVTSSAAVPFTIDVPAATLQEIARRVRDTNWPDSPAGNGWDYGFDRAALRSLAEYLVAEYDWRAQERALNRYRHFRAEIAGEGLHFVHEPGSGSSPQPLLLLHGWPYSFATFLPLVDQLAHPERFGGDAEDGFDVVIPSLPGYGFSDRPAAPIGPREMARRMNELMTTVLGYDRYIAQGGDWGAPIASWLAFDHAARSNGIHLNSVGIGPAGPPFWIIDPGPGPLSEERRAAVAAAQTQFFRDMSHFFLQGVRPLTASYGVTDSPIGAAAWILDKWYLWSDRRKRPFAEIFTSDQLLTEVMVYLVTGTIDTSFWIYNGFFAEESWALQPGERIELPVGFAAFPDPLGVPPRESLEKVYSIVHWTDMPVGGHLPMAETPDLFLRDVQQFGRLVR